MASVSIRDVPDETRDALAARAASSGRSLQEYLRVQLIELALRPESQTIVTRIRDREVRTGSQLPSEKILRHRDTDRA